MKEYRGVRRVKVKDVLWSIDEGGGGEGDEYAAGAAVISGVSSDSMCLAW